MFTENNEFEPNDILQNVTDSYSYFVPVLCFYVKFTKSDTPCYLRQKPCLLLVFCGQTKEFESCEPGCVRSGFATGGLRIGFL